ncbi:cell cycle checkpoint control protein RAD9B isoform X3 [Paramormyrops kingsleyae]|uniref:cell cycle checkpoint control protein RAD9B isoform X3 n=1 Tax=Paramormyrops kingsleyae TaxID=1676925 RepID=UPI000CD5CDBF|nr:cell cycle checkpoint control protein RAD9B isoform X3 [Paramormyrops kingsleyae]
MKCVIEGSNVKVFGKAIHALSRISDEMWLDPLEKGLAVRSVGPAHSSYGCFLFTRLFFQLYSLNISSPQAALGRCKLPVKSVLPLFRCSASIERSVDSCKISTGLSDTQVTFQLFCKHESLQLAMLCGIGITKTYNLGFQEHDVLQAVFPAHLCPNVLKAQPSLLGDMVIHFPASQEEVTLSVCPKRVTMRNYCEERGVDSDITFCLKELRGLLSFAESHGLPVYVHFGHPGQPVRFSVENMVLEASVVLATQTDSESEVSVQPGGSEDPAAPSVCLSVERSQSWSPCMPPSVCTGGGVESRPQDAPPTAPPEEQVPSSQGSPVLSRPGNLEYFGLHVATDSGAHAAEPESADPATFRLHSLLFGAVSSPWPNEGDVLHTSLACASDTEEDNMEERSSATPMPIY